MDVGATMSVVQTLSQALESSQLIEYICSIANYKSQLDELRGTVDKIKAVLQQAEAKQELSTRDQLSIEDLKDAVYKADDLFDEFVILAEQRKLTGQGIKNRLLPFFSKFGEAYKMAKGVEKIKKKLEAITRDNQLLSSFKDVSGNEKKERPAETISYVPVADIIGRKSDLEKIVDTLLKPRVQRKVSFLTIVGIGGMGKTALAQLVFNDEQITAAFSLRRWTCIADYDQKKLDIEGTLSKILSGITGQKHKGFTADWVQSQVREKIRGQKYLLVLDNVWTEHSQEQWRRLAGFLMGGQMGSWIVVTTRSRKTAKIINGQIHELQGLSKDDSWCLFHRTVFGPEESNPPEDLVLIGQKIVESCANVPLAITVVGTLLCGKEKPYWQLLQESGLANSSKDSKNDIMSALKLSYYYLDTSLKSCFSYCAMFPKNFEIEKKALISLWMAQGYIPSENCPSMEDIGEEYFSILLQRCFFQRVQKDEYGDIYSCEMHDLMHDVAKEVVGKEICTEKTIIGKLDKKVRHFSLTRSKSAKYLFTKTDARSYLHVGRLKEIAKMDQRNVETLLSNWKRLRALDLSRSNILSIPSSIGDLLHLRYLGLSYNEDLEVLPNSITKLHNLQSLRLPYCKRLKELPSDMSKQGKLRVLDIKDCDELTCMPRGMGSLASLHELAMFVVREVSSWRELFEELEDLKALEKLKGFLEIKIHFSKMGATVKEDGPSGRGCLENKERINYLRFTFCGEEDDARRASYDEKVMEEMKIPSNLKGLEIRRYHGVRMPTWAFEDNLLSFVKLKFLDCTCLQYFPCLRNLRHLKVLHVSHLLNLEYIENSPTTGLPSDGEGTSFFPSLEELHLEHLPKLKGWWREVGAASTSTSMAPLRLFQLKTLVIQSCPVLRAILHCPILDHINVNDVNNRMRIITSMDEIGDANYTSCIELLEELRSGCEEMELRTKLEDLINKYKTISARSGLISSRG